MNLVLNDRQTDLTGRQTDKALTGMDRCCIFNAVHTEKLFCFFFFPLQPTQSPRQSCCAIGYAGLPLIVSGESRTQGFPTQKTSLAYCLARNLKGRCGSLLRQRREEEEEEEET